MNGHILPQYSFIQNIQDIPWSQTHVTFNCKLSNIDTTAYQNDLDLKLGIVLILIIVMSIILGNEHLHQLTAQGKYSLRINMGDFESNQRYAVYKQFVVGDEKSGYKLTVGGYKGNAGMS